MPRFSASWKLKCKGHSDLTSTYSGIEANNESEVKEKTVECLKKDHSKAFKDGYEIAEIKIKKTS